MKKKPTAYEARVLDVLLVELRRAVKLRAQLNIIIDPFVDGSGTYVFAAPNVSGRSYTIENASKPTKKRRTA